MYLFCEGYGDQRELHVLTHSVPTRRSSDLQEALRKELRAYFAGLMTPEVQEEMASGDGEYGNGDLYKQLVRRMGEDGWLRSEEHTSELQSLMRISYAVFCLNKKTCEMNTTRYTSM